GVNDLSLWVCDYFSGRGTVSEPLCGGGGGASAVITTGQVNLGWNECAAAATGSNRAFACNTNSGSEHVVVSIIPGQSAGQVSAFDARIDLQSAPSTSLPAWWHFENGSANCGGGSSVGCRSTSLSASTDFSAFSTCTDPGFSSSAVFTSASYSITSTNS